MPEALLRDATGADSEAVRALVRGILAEFGLTPDPEGTDADLEDLEGHYLARGGRFWVLEDADGAVVGSCGLYPLGDGTVELRKMYVSSTLRGRGWGRRLLEHAIAAARRDRYRTMRLETASVLRDAIRLYERNGFVRVACRPHSSRCDQLWSLELAS